MHERILIDPAIQFGRPVIRGTRIPVTHVLHRLAEGRTVAELLRDHPRLTEDDVWAAVAFAADYLAAEGTLTLAA